MRTHMAEYLSTREVAAYLKLNEKKIYALIQAGQLPAARVSGKWLFPRHLIDRWVEEHTVYPTRGVMGAVLDELLVMQGSDDWLLSRTLEGIMARRGDELQLVEGRVGSLAGLSAVGKGRAHLAGVHVDRGDVEALIDDPTGCYLVHLFARTQGLIYSRSLQPALRGLADVATGGVTFAERQPGSGTWRLARRALAEAGVDPDRLTRVGPFASHLELALAIRTGRADVGVGIHVAADLCGLDFLPITNEAFRLAVPVAYASHPRMARFLDSTLQALRDVETGALPGYDLSRLGHMETTTTRTTGQVLTENGDPDV